MYRFSLCLIVHCRVDCSWNHEVKAGSCTWDGDGRGITNAARAVNSKLKFSSLEQLGTMVTAVKCEHYEIIFIFL